MHPPPAILGTGPSPPGRYPVDLATAGQQDRNDVLAHGDGVLQLNFAVAAVHVEVAEEDKDHCALANTLDHLGLEVLPSSHPPSNIQPAHHLVLDIEPSSQRLHDAVGAPHHRTVNHGFHSPVVGNEHLRGNDVEDPNTGGAAGSTAFVTLKSPDPITVVLVEVQEAAGAVEAEGRSLAMQHALWTRQSVVDHGPGQDVCHWHSMSV
mmetsp:Transcript_69115/g.144100  ORF Transcript_69115/g.144100 Transcript_69115/m.144100 type:complete len:207 (+) Transcript_69115:738-1358(+)